MKEALTGAFDLSPYMNKYMRAFTGYKTSWYDTMIYCCHPYPEAWALSRDGGILYQDRHGRGFGLVYEAECQEGMSRDEILAMLTLLAYEPHKSDWDQVAPRLTEITGIFYSY